MLDWPSINPENFSKHQPSDPATPSKMKPTTYQATHDRTRPPPHQVITTEPRNTFITNFYQRTVDKPRMKRRAVEDLSPEREGKIPKGYWSV